MILQSRLEGLGDVASAWGPFLGVVVAAAIVGWLFNRFVIAFIRAVAGKTKTRVDDIIIKAVHPALVFTLFFAGIAVALEWYGSTLPRQFVTWAGGATLGVIVFLVALSAARLASAVLHHRARQEPRWTPAATLGSRLLGAIIWVLALLTVLRHYGFEITPLLTSLGLAGLAIALALQDTLANFFAGVWIQTGRSLWPGHYVKIEEKNLEGFIVEVGWRTTKIRSLPGNIILIPNQVLAQSTVTDFWLPEPKMGASLTVVTAFETDPDRVAPMILEEIRAATSEVDYILKDPEPFCRLNRRVDNGWEFWMSFWVPYYYNQWNAQGYVLNKIRKRFLKEGIRMPLPIAEEYRVPDGRRDIVDSIVSVRRSRDGAPAPTDQAVPPSRPSQQGPPG